MDVPPTLVPQTVGELATAMASEYVRTVDWHSTIAPGKGVPGFAGYWAARKDRTHCASWFEVRLRRACGATNPVPDDRIDAVRAVRRQIDRLPEPDRTLTLLWIRPDFDAKELLVTEADLVAGCRAVGPDGLVKLLQRKPPTDDPDIRGEPYSGNRHPRMQEFVLEHTGELLRPTDADAVLACRRWEADFQTRGNTDPTLTPLWRIAAAALRPADSGRLLDEARAEFRGQYESDHRRRIAQAYWRMIPNPDPAVVATWFYEEKPDLSCFKHARAQFLFDLGAKPRPGDRRLIVALLADDRLAKLDWQSVDQFAKLANSWEGRPVIDPEALRAAWHPFGMGHFDRDMAASRAKYPKETDELLRTLNGWRAILRAWGRTLREPA